MATTVTAPVGNTIALAEKYLPILDEIYKVGSRSAILDTASERVRWEGAKKAYLFNTQLVGLANYDRNGLRLVFEDAYGDTAVSVLPHRHD